MEENNAKLNAICEVTTETDQEPEERQRKPTILYKKQIKNALPKGARIGKNVYVVLNNEFNDQLETVLKLALKQAQDRGKVTLSGNDIKNALTEYKKQGATYILDVMETTVLNKIREIKEATKGSE